MVGSEDKKPGRRPSIGACVQLRAELDRGRKKHQRQFPHPPAAAAARGLRRQEGRQVGRQVRQQFIPSQPSRGHGIRCVVGYLCPSPALCWTKLAIGGRPIAHFSCPPEQFRPKSDLHLYAFGTRLTLLILPPIRNSPGETVPISANARLLTARLSVLSLPSMDEQCHPRP